MNTLSDGPSAGRQQSNPILKGVQTVWLQPKRDRIPFFFKESGFFLDFAQSNDPRKLSIFDLMEKNPMIGIPTH